MEQLTRCECLGTRASFKINLYKLQEVVTFLLMTTNQTTEATETITNLFTQWANENAAKIKLLAHLQTLTEAEKIALFEEVMG